MSQKPSVLVLGGLGFIGRNFITYLIENNLTSEIRVVDKNLLQTTALNPRQKEAFSKVEILQKDLVDLASIRLVFTRTEDSSFDYVFNLAAETKYSQAEKVYEERVYTLSVRNAEEAARRNVKVFVEISTAEIYQGDKNTSKEGEKIKPWTMCAKHKHRAEEKIKTIENLNLVILRPAIVYGPGATMGITPRIICGRIYKLLNEEMKFLWSKDLKINTVHVIDVVRAMWFMATWYQENNKAGTSPVIYNLADSGDTDQDRISKHISRIFEIKTGFHGFTTYITQLNPNVVDEINNKHLGPWTKFIKDYKKIKNTPLTPYLDKELLYNNALAVDGSKITAETGFQYDVPEVTDEKLVEMIEDFKVLGWWPNESTTYT